MYQRFNPLTGIRCFLTWWQIQTDSNLKHPPRFQSPHGDSLFSDLHPKTNWHSKGGRGFNPLMGIRCFLTWSTQRVASIRHRLGFNPLTGIRCFLTNLPDYRV